MPSSTPSQAGRSGVRGALGAQLQGRTVPGGGGAAGNLPKVPGEALVLPHLELATAAAQERTQRVAEPRAERGRRDSALLRRPRAQGPAHAAPPEAAGPWPGARPSQVAPPLPPRPWGDLPLAPRDLGRLEAVPLSPPGFLRQSLPSARLPRTVASPQHPLQ